MKKKYSIRFLVATFVCLIALTVAYQMSYRHARMELKQEEKGKQPSVATEGEAIQSNIYYLKELNGFIAVYQGDKKTVFEYTDIRMEELPSDLAEEIKEGKNFPVLRQCTVSWKITPVDKKEERTKEMLEEKIERINELYRKSKAEGLTEEELQEQKVLRAEYIDAFKRNLRGQLNNISIQEKDGTITNLGEKFGNKKTN